MNFWTCGIYDLFKYGLVQWLFDTFTLTETQSSLIIGGGFLLCIVASYLLGSISFAVLISRVFYHDDVRKYGSGNAGTTNMLRTFGKKAALMTFVGDTFKGVIAILIACLVFGASLESNVGGYWLLVTASYLSAFMCILGHVFPIFAKFRGGKGFATLLAAIAALDPVVFLLLMVVYFPMILMTHYVSLSSITIALFYPVLLATVDRTVPLHIGTHIMIALLMGLLVTWCHRSNISRLIKGKERKTYLFKKKESAKTDEAPATTGGNGENEA